MRANAKKRIRTRSVFLSVVSLSKWEACVVMHTSISVSLLVNRYAVDNNGRRRGTTTKAAQFPLDVLHLYTYPMQLQTNHWIVSRVYSVCVHRVKCRHFVKSRNSLIHNTLKVIITESHYVPLADKLVNQSASQPARQHFSRLGHRNRRTSSSS